MTKQFKQRLVISVLSVISLILCIYLSFNPIFKPIFTLITAAITSLALREYYQLCKLKGHEPHIALGIGTAFLYLFTLSYSIHEKNLVGVPSLVLLFSMLLFFLLSFKKPASSLTNLAITLFGIVYLVIPLGCILRINYFFPLANLEDGRLWLAYALIVIKMTDIGGYLFGKCFGQHKLAPMISPKKTVEGSLGGVVTALLTSLFIYSLAGLLEIRPLLPITLYQSLWLGFVLSILAQLGDLSESILKRDAGVKDSSHLPGLGGVLDVVDSLVFALPFMYLMLQMQLVG